MSSDNVIFGDASIAAQKAQAAQSAAIEALAIKNNRLNRNEPTIALPFGRRISAKPYAALRFSNRQNWWLANPVDLISPEHRREDCRLPDGTWCLAWPNSTEEGTTMYLAGDGFYPVRWSEIDKTLGARVRTHSGTTQRGDTKSEADGFVYWKRHILVWVSPLLWEEEHITPLLRSFSQLANIEPEFADIIESASVKATGKNLVEGVAQREVQSTQVPATGFAPEAE